jgi:hypothetical protein
MTLKSIEVMGMLPYATKLLLSVNFLGNFSNFLGIFSFFSWKSLNKIII